MTFSSAFVYQKLETLGGYTDELKRLLAETPDSEFFTDSGKFHIAERLVQLIVDGMIDINQHFIRELELEIPEDLRSTFEIIGMHGVLPDAFAKKIAPIVGVRNILVHQYEKLDKGLFMKNLRDHCSDFDIYQRRIAEYLKKIEQK